MTKNGGLIRANTNCSLVLLGSYSSIGSGTVANSRSVYGNSNNFPLKETDNTDKPLSFYAATKKSNELIAHSYSHLFNLNTIGDSETYESSVTIDPNWDINQIKFVALVQSFSDDEILQASSMSVPLNNLLIIL